MADIRRKPNGAFLVRWREDGKQKYRQFRSEADAVAFKATKEPSALDRMTDQAKREGTFVDLFGKYDRFGRPLDAPKAADEKWTVTAYARRIVAADGGLTRSTRLTYERAIRRYLDGTDLGAADLRAVTPEELAAWWATVETGRADAYRLLSKVLKRAFVARDREDNPLERVPEIKKPRPGDEEERQPLTASQIEELADAATRTTKGFKGQVGAMVRERDRLMILTMGFCGLRAGEVGGLRKVDLLDRCRLRVEQQVVRASPGVAPEVTRLKTQASRRTITIACSLWDELRAFVDRYGVADDGRIFRGPNGELRDHSLTNNVVRRAAKRAGMPGVHSHLLRHSAISLLIDAGHNAVQIQRFAGHSNITTTLGVYGHRFDQAGSDLATTMENLREPTPERRELTP